MHDGAATAGSRPVVHPTFTPDVGPRVGPEGPSSNSEITFRDQCQFGSEGDPAGSPPPCAMEMAGSQWSGEVPGADQALLNGSVIGQRAH